MGALTRRLIRIGDALSQLCNAAFCGGHPNESMSGRSYREGLWTEKWIDRLFFVLFADRNHCRNAYDNDVRYAEELVKNRLNGVHR